MCGILGLYDSNKINKNLFTESIKLLNERGPDNTSINLINENISLGHTRLSIIDLDSNNNQPFIEKNFHLTYNGEIFNFLELKDELIKLGYNFVTNGDTEVVMKAFIHWGKDCVNRFNGMWAFVIYDKNENSFFCSRDRFGIKPFYYYFDKSKFIFSSQIKPILKYYPNLRKVNYNSINNYFNSGAGAQSRETWFENIFRLEPAHNLSVKGNRIKFNRYWEYPSTKLNISFKKAKHDFFDLLKDSVNIRLKSDVKLASTITSGLDSSSIVAMCNHINENKIDTYTSFSDDKSYGKNDRLEFTKPQVLDESQMIKKIKHKLNIKPHYNKLNFDSYYSDLTKVIYNLESGHSSTATVSAMSLYKEIRKKHTVILEGQGADEMLGGYVTELFPSLVYNYIKKFRLIKLVKLFKDFNSNYNFKSILSSYLNSIFKKKYLIKFKMKFLNADIVNKKILNAIIRNSDIQCNNSLFVDQHSNGLVNLLHYGDSLSMSNSIETRFPFLDYRLVEFCFKLPLDYLYNSGKGKFILRESMKDLLPKEIYDSSLKLGFVTPIDKILKEDKSIKENLYSNDSLGFFDQKKLVKLLDQFYNEDFKHNTIIFKILSIKIWINIFIDEEYEDKL
jgi:asparagine synthase (glutamine-hydrolysing)